MTDEETITPSLHLDFIEELDLDQTTVLVTYEEEVV
jgi:hypothetical protein